MQGIPAGIFSDGIGAVMYLLLVIPFRYNITHGIYAAQIYTSRLVEDFLSGNRGPFACAGIRADAGAT